MWLAVFLLVEGRVGKWLKVYALAPDCPILMQVAPLTNCWTSGKFHFSFNFLF